MAETKTELLTQQSQALFARAERVIPGGVNSPVRAFGAVGGKPRFIKSAIGAYLFDEDGNKLIDLIGSWGPMILGHAHHEVKTAVLDAVPQSLSFGAPTRREVEMAELVCEMVPSVEVVRMVNSGTEATLSAIRLARGATGRDKIVKFEGCYHGHGDSFLIAAGSGAQTLGTPNSPGVTAATAKDTLLAKYNDLKSVEACFDGKGGEAIAAIIVEPVAGNMGCVPPQPGFLEGLRSICDKHGALLIFDEVMTGFRLAPGGAQQVYGVMPDLTCLGKIIGGGLPVGAYGGKKELMNQVSPAGPVYQAGTLSGNPIGMAAGHATLKYLKEHPEAYNHLEAISAKIALGLRDILTELDLPYTLNRVGSMITLFFTKENVTNFEQAKTTDTEAYGRFFHNMLAEGVYLPPSQYEAWFLSTAITDDLADRILAAARHSLSQLEPA